VEKETESNKPSGLEVLQSLGIEMRGDSDVTSVISVLPTVGDVTLINPTHPTDGDADLTSVTTREPVNEELTFVKTTQPAADSSNSNDEWKLALKPLPIGDIQVVKCSRDFWENWKSQSYPMSLPCRGKCLIICNEEFNCNDSTNYSMRQGADVDLTNMCSLFEALHFSVDCHKNLTAKDMRHIVKTTSCDDAHSDAQCFVMCIMSHGKLTSDRPTRDEPVNAEVVLGCDGKVVPTSTLLAPFADEYCLALRGKPRIILFQACRGEVVDKTESDSIPERPSSISSLSMTDAEPDEPQDPTVSNRPVSLKDFIIGYPTQSGFRSFRNTAVGSWYINALTRVFAERACDTDVPTMLRSVNSFVSKWVSCSDNPELHRGTQVASIVDSLTKDHLYLFPGIMEQLPDNQPAPS
jgi:hypothetical protein